MTVIRMLVATVTASLAAKMSLGAVIVYNHCLGRRKWRYNRSIKPAPGVYTAQFSAHITRSASTSVALSSGVSVDVVLRAAGWRSESTFTRFYRKEPAVNMGQAFLDSYLHKN